MHYLSGQGLLHTVVIPGARDKHNVLIELNAQHLRIPFKYLSKDELTTAFKELLYEAKPDVVFVFGCRYKIPVDLFSIPRLGFYNVHFSLLPAYRGSAPMFWQIRNGETTGGITIHQVTEAFDSGPMIAQQQTNISPGENCGLFTARLSMETVGLIGQAIERLKTFGGPMLLPQNESSASYFKRPDAPDFQVDWEKQPAMEIENIVNAANPDYGGATASFRGQPFRILEVNQVELPNPQPTAPGIIVHSDINYGVIVSCKDKRFLRINIAQLSEGIFSGFKLASLGIKAGERFDDASKLLGVAINP
jgi:methionyl-tRNA formyltransferase